MSVRLAHKPSVNKHSWRYITPTLRALPLLPPLSRSGKINLDEGHLRPYTEICKYAVQHTHTVDCRLIGYAHIHK